MDESLHSWLEVDSVALVRGLRKLGRLPKPPKPARKVILAFDDGALQLSNGVASVSVAASGEWPVAAVLHWAVLEALIKVVDGAGGDGVVRLEGVGERIRIGASSFSCSFQNPAINVRGAIEGERRLQGFGER